MNEEIRQKILELVHIRPRAISEIAFTINKNWRTADKYVKQLSSEDIIKVHTFRKGSHGALKLAYWPSQISQEPSSIKNFLFQKIINGVKKDDFSPLDIAQNIPEDRRKIEYIKRNLYETEYNTKNFVSILDKAENRILFLSGNLSFISLGNKSELIMDLIEKKLKQGVQIFILTRVDSSNASIIENLLNINKKNYLAKLQIRYAYQPLRCTVIDSKLAHFKEDFSLYSKTGDKDSLNGIYIYSITDQNWIEWIINVFWYLWRGSIDAEHRLKVLKEYKINL